MRALRDFAALFFLLLTANSLRAAEPMPKINYDEAKIPPYTLPNPLVCGDGTTVADAKIWRELRRPEILELFRKHMHGRSPAKPADSKFELVSSDPKALGGQATRKEITITFGSGPDAPKSHLLLYVPNTVIANNAKQPAPVLLGMNFDGNHTVDADPGITIHEQWEWNKQENREVFARPAEETRGSSASRWQLATLLGRGYAVATIPRADIEPDYATGWKHGVRGYYLAKSGKADFAPDDWGAVAAWAWGLSRAMDYIETDPQLDAKRVVLHGHSRLGKASLWAGAEDPRFAVVISNNSGEGGAALARRSFGETTAVMNDRFPHWFCANFKQYGDREDRLPIDQHELIALSAPRPVYVASAEEDRWADPRGEFLSAKHAEPVYTLFAKAGLEVAEMPAVNHPVGATIGYHIRDGKHDVTLYDWQQYLAFADRHFGRETVGQASPDRK